MRPQTLKNQKKKYKALILDVDGTLILNKRDGMPSKRVTEAINKASKLIHIGVATSRPYFILSHIVDHLKLSGPSIIVGGAQIIDTASKKILFEQPLLKKDLLKIVKLLRTSHVPLTVLDNGKDIVVSQSYKPKNPLQLWLPGLTPQEADMYINKLSHIPTIDVQKLPSWIRNKIDIVISHASATKQHAILEVSKVLNIQTQDIIGVGDGYNDFPLLMACGLKAAMGNAVEELKAIADYIAPSVEEDGVAHVINKFILYKN
ncbi:MAG: HAD hydrolase family protein [Patescibacteria group bacterium]